MNVLYNNEEDYIVQLSNEEYRLVQEFLNQVFIDVILEYKHFPQNGPGADLYRNDCGAAVAASIIHSKYRKITVDTIAEKFQRPNMNMFILEVQNALTAYGFKNAHKIGYSASEVTQNIRVGDPSIVLVHYPSMPHQAVKFNGGHYILVYGVLSSGKLLYHDPLTNGDRVCYISPEELDKAMADAVKDDNKPNQGIVILNRG